MPASGGETVYLARAWGPRWAFLFGWVNLTIAGPASIAAVSRTFADYAATVRPMGEWQVRLLAAGLVVALTLLVIRTTAGSTRLLTAATFGKIAAMVAVLVAAIALAPAGPPVAQAAPATGAGLRDIGLAFTSILFAYKGFQMVVLIGGEVKEPQRTLPLGLLLGSAVLIALYVGLNLAYTAVLGFDGVKASPAVAADTMGVLLGASGSTFVAAMVMTCTFGTVLASLIGYPRMAFAMAERGVFFPAFLRLSRWKTPWVGTLIAGPIAVVLVLSGTFAFLSRLAVMALFPLMALALVGAMRLRRLEGLPEGYRMPLYPLPVLFFTAVVVAVTLFASLGDPRAAALSAGTVVVGLLVEPFLRRRPPA
jgi:amino acid transporter